MISFFLQCLDPLGNVIEKVTNAGTVYKESKYYYWEPQSGIDLLSLQYRRYFGT